MPNYSPNYQDYCDVNTGGDPSYYDTCNAEYNQARQEYNVMKFVVFAVIGVIMILTSMFVEVTFLMVALLIGGFLILFSGLIGNLENQLIVFVTLVGAILMLIGVALKKFYDG